ncbi:MAG: hypothetical protein GY730_02235, partial [bacterium]|nr:hypothetical protein [bacterium]
KKNDKTDKSNKKNNVFSSFKNALHLNSKNKKKHSRHKTTIVNDTGAKYDEALRSHLDISKDTIYNKEIITLNAPNQSTEKPGLLEQDQLDHLVYLIGMGDTDEAYKSIANNPAIKDQLLNAVTQKILLKKMYTHEKQSIRDLYETSSSGTAEMSSDNEQNNGSVIEHNDDIFAITNELLPQTAMEQDMIPPPPPPPTQSPANTVPFPPIHIKKQRSIIQSETDLIQLIPLNELKENYADVVKNNSSNSSYNDDFLADVNPLPQPAMRSDIIQPKTAPAQTNTMEAFQQEYLKFAEEDSSNAENSSDSNYSNFSSYTSDSESETPPPPPPPPPPIPVAITDNTKQESSSKTKLKIDEKTNDILSNLFEQYNNNNNKNKK